MSNFAVRAVLRVSGLNIKTDMIKLGKYQTLEISRVVEFGAYLREPDTAGPEVLLPSRYLPENPTEGDRIEVFVYKDSEDRPVATTEHPYATVGEFAFLEVNAVNDVGAFMDWGLPKDLLVPYREQRVRMRRGGIYLVYIYLDDATGRIVASAKVDKFLGNVLPDYKVGQKVQALVTEHTEIGYKVIVDNMHRGILYSNELFRPVEIEETLTAYVKRVREDGKIDLTLSDKAGKRIGGTAEAILEYLDSSDRVPVGDKSDPELISRLFGCSKRDFKQAVGHLYRDKKITIGADGMIAKL